MKTPVQRPKLPDDLLPMLIDPRPLLAFSGGVDSSALFFLLMEVGISCDLAIVHYHRRPQADEEVAYAQTLAKRYGLLCHVAHARLNEANFEAEARAFRYRFFASLRYETVLTAHQLDDRLEWLLMRLADGAGCVELAGMQPIEEREGYRLVRPLLEYPKERLRRWLEHSGYHYFIDESNDDPRHRRNRFRPIARLLMEENGAGIARSLAYLRRDADSLWQPPQIQETAKLLTAPLRPQTLQRDLAWLLKRAGYLASARQLEEALKQQEGVLGGKWAFGWRRERLWIAPFVQERLNKPFRELCRTEGVPPVIRGYLWRLWLSAVAEGIGLSDFGAWVAFLSANGATDGGGEATLRLA